MNIAKNYASMLQNIRAVTTVQRKLIYFAKLNLQRTPQNINVTASQILNKMS